MPHALAGESKKKTAHVVGGPEFVAPDGGWGWMIVIAAGCSNLCTFPVLQQFGLLFRDRFEHLEISSSKTTTIINLNSALTSCVGLANGPMFRRFTFRQVSFCGAVLVAVGLFFTSIADSFPTYVISFSIIYGAGVGIATSANSLALNTYFKLRRRVATGFSWTATALGPIVMPHVITTLMVLYGVQGTVLLYSGFALNAVVCSLLLQPVHWHTKKPEKVKQEVKMDTEIEKPLVDQQSDGESGYFGDRSKSKSRSVFSSQYLYNDDEHNVTGYEIIDPGTPMLSRANDGWYSSGRRSLVGSKQSLYSNKAKRYDPDSKKASNQNLSISKRPSNPNLQEIRSRRTSVINSADSRKDAYVNLEVLSQENKRKWKQKDLTLKIDEEAAAEDCPSYKAPQDLKQFERHLSMDNKTEDPRDRKYNRDNHSVMSSKVASEYKIKNNTFNLENEVLKEASRKLEQYVCENQKNRVKHIMNKNGFACTEENYNTKPNKEIVAEVECETEDEDVEHYTCFQKLVIFFDLDLLKDLTYVNLMLGVTIANFAELNFSILTPFVLGDFGFSRQQVALAMSLLGGMDISVRFLIPFIAGKIGWENRTFFLFGVMGMAMGRILLAHFRTYWVVLVASCWIGFNKGLRTVFMALVIPSYIPLDRLPGATGLQLLSAGILYLTMGPVVGLVRDATNYTVTLHCLNIMTYAVAISWGAEKLYRTRQEKSAIRQEQMNPKETPC